MSCLSPYFFTLNTTKTISDKCSNLKSKHFSKIQYGSVSDISSRIPLNKIVVNQDTVGKYTKSVEGLSTGDKDRFILKFWELKHIDINRWSYYQNSPQVTSPYTGMSEILMWEKGEGLLAEYSAARIQGHEAWGKKGILSCKMGKIRSTIYLGGLYDKTCVALTPSSSDAFKTLYKLSQADHYDEVIRQLDARLCVATSVFESVPLEIDNSLPELPTPYSGDPTQWIFHGYPDQSEEPLQVAVARLLGYHWPAEDGSEIDLSDEAQSWIEKTESLASFIDDDGIVCLPAVRGEKAGC